MTDQVYAGLQSLITKKDGDGFTPEIKNPARLVSLLQRLLNEIRNANAVPGALFTEALDFSGSRRMADHVQVTDLSFSLSDTEPLPGSVITVKITGDGIHDCSFSDVFFVFDNFDNLRENYFTFRCQTAGEVWVSIQHAARDLDAIAFIEAVGTLTTLQQNAIHNLVFELKAAGLWDKCSAIYPLVGGTALAHRWNLKNPLDTDGAFRLTFGGGETHGELGITWDGASSANTHLVPATHLPDYDTTFAHLSVYSQGDTNDAGVDLGVRTDIILLILEWGIQLTNTGGEAYFMISDNTYNVNSPLGGTNDGFFVANRTGSSTENAWRDGVKIVSSTANPTSALPPIPILLGAQNADAGPGRYTSRTHSFISIGQGLTDAENGMLNTLVQAYQAALSRQA